jgi:hypothetical protein
MQMEQVYMLFHEARRVLKVGGKIHLLNLRPPEKKWSDFLRPHRTPYRFLEVLHYISPENWLTERHELFAQDGLNHEVWIATKLSGAILDSKPDDSPSDC